MLAGTASIMYELGRTKDFYFCAASRFDYIVIGAVYKCEKCKNSENYKNELILFSLDYINHLINSHPIHLNVHLTII